MQLAYVKRHAATLHDDCPGHGCARNACHVPSEAAVHHGRVLERLGAAALHRQLQ